MARQGELQLIRFLIVLTSRAVPPAFAFGGMALILVVHPSANIETQGWVLGWTGMGGGFIAGLICVGAIWHTRRKARLVA